MRPPTSASLWIRCLDEVEQFAEKGQCRFAPMVFTFSPERCSASFRNAVQKARNPQLRIPRERERDSGVIANAVPG